MKKIFICAALAASLLVALNTPLLASNVTLIMPNGSESAPATPNTAQYPAQPALFKFTNGNATVYLFGTAHSVVKGIKWRTNEFNRAIARADRIWFESTFREMANPVLTFDLIDSMKNQDGKRIEDLLSRDEMAKLIKVAREQNVDIDEYGEFHPWVIAEMLTGAQYKTSIKKDASQEIESVAGVERLIESSGIGKPILPVENTRKSMLLFSRLSPEDEKAYLMDTVDQIDHSQKDEVTAIMSAWSKGDLTAISTTSDKMRKNTPGLYKIMLTERNKIMFDKIETLLHGSGTEFVGVGVAHLAGPGGLVSMLEQAGYKGERIYDTEPPVASDSERKIRRPHYRTDLLIPRRLTVSLVRGQKPDEVLLHLSRDQTVNGCAEISPIKTKTVKSEDTLEVSVMGYFASIHPYPNIEGCGPAVKVAAGDVPLSIAELKKYKTSTLKLGSALGYDLYTLNYEDGTLTLTPVGVSQLFFPDLKKLAVTGL